MSGKAKATSSTQQATMFSFFTKKENCTQQQPANLAESKPLKETGASGKAAKPVAAKQPSSSPSPPEPTEAKSPAAKSPKGKSPAGTATSSKQPRGAAVPAETTAKQQPAAAPPKSKTPTKVAPSPPPKTPLLPGLSGDAKAALLTAWQYGRIFGEALGLPSPPTLEALHDGVTGGTAAAAAVGGAVGALHVALLRTLLRAEDDDLDDDDDDDNDDDAPADGERLSEAQREREARRAEVRRQVRASTRRRAGRSMGARAAIPPDRARAATAPPTCGRPRVSPARDPAPLSRRHSLCHHHFAQRRAALPPRARRLGREGARL
eukprot:7187919-Prymnesium_polylepis.1